MGNSSSTSTPATAGEGPEDGATASGVFLSDELQSKILGDFQSKVLREEWEKHQKYLIAKGNQRRLQEYQTKEQIDQKLEQFRAQDSVRQSQLDQRMDDLRARFSDAATALQFDVQRIDQTLSSLSIKENEAPCIGPRTNVSMCLTSDSKKDCSDFVRALEQCVADKIVLKQ